MTAAGDRRAIFLDRDGVLVVPEFRAGRSFAPRSLADFRLYDGAAECLARLKAARFLLIVVTNQPDVGNRLVPQDVVEEMHRRMALALPLDGIEVCYHRQADNCDCRKPKPGMLLRAASRYGVDCQRSFMIGDRLGDVTAGRAVGCTTILIDLGYREEGSATPEFTVESLHAATEVVLRCM